MPDILPSTVLRERDELPSSLLRASASRKPWVIVAGGFHWRGGIDRANAEFAFQLSRWGASLHLVAYEVDDGIARRQNVHCHIVHRPYGSFLLGEVGLHRRGVTVARAVLRNHPEAHVLVNGGNCPWGDLNWMHSVHAAWHCCDRGAPLWFRLKNRLSKALFLHWERCSVKKARIVIANSERTRLQVIERYRIDSERVRTVYLGSDHGVSPVTLEQRQKARARFSIPEDQPVVLFLGALSYDNNKGIDTLLTAWRQLRDSHGWDAHLLVAGGGGAVRQWTNWCRDEGLTDSVLFLGFTNQVGECIAAADLLISPVRYEAYGLNVQEAICRGIPAMVSKSAGIAERFPEELSDMLIEDPEDAAGIAKQLLAWRGQIRSWKLRIDRFRQELCGHSWQDMTERIVELVDSSRQHGEAAIRS